MTTPTPAPTSREAVERLANQLHNVREIVDYGHGAFLTVAATPTAEQAAVARAPIGVSDEAMTGAWRVIIARVPDRYVTYYYHENDDARLRLALRAQAERWVASQLDKLDDRQCADCGYPVGDKPVFLGGVWFCATCNPAISHLGGNGEPSP